MVPELTTERLLLRQFRGEDFEPFARFFTDPLASRYVGGPGDREQAWRRMAMLSGHWMLRGFGYWALVERSSEEFAGAAGLWRSDGWPELELGYWLLPAMQGKGYATEAARRARTYAFEVLRAETLVSYIHPDNEPSRRVAERLGAEYEGTVDLLHFGKHMVYRHPAESPP